ncbi:unnamed protein product, partial [Porites evermanni]
MGCTTKVQRKEIESHLQESVRPHVDLAFAKLTSTQEELKRSQDLTSKLNEKFNALERQFKEQHTEKTPRGRKVSCGL